MRHHPRSRSSMALPSRNNICIQNKSPDVSSRRWIWEGSTVLLTYTRQLFIFFCVLSFCILQPHRDCCPVGLQQNSHRRFCYVAQFFFFFYGFHHSLLFVHKAKFNTHRCAVSLEKHVTRHINGKAKKFNAISINSFFFVLDKRGEYE